MRANYLKKKYPELWEEVYKGAIETNNMLEFDIPEEKIRVIAHNAAFEACYYVHNNIKLKKA